MELMEVCKSIYRMHAISKAKLLRTRDDRFTAATGVSCLMMGGRPHSATAPTRAILAVVRSIEQWLALVPKEHLGETVGRIIHREMLLSWKAAAEEEKPVLLSRTEEIRRKTHNLALWDSEIREANQELLGMNVDGTSIANQRQWHALTLLSGPNARRLREVFANGMELGLLKLRPVWLMVPEVASQLLPLKAGLFDVVVFDEASQMPVEHALRRKTARPRTTLY